MLSGDCGQALPDVIGSAGNKAEWEACPGCLATGPANEKPCGQCCGVGWVYVRNRKQ